MGAPEPSGFERSPLRVIVMEPAFPFRCWPPSVAKKKKLDPFFSTPNGPSGQAKMSTSGGCARLPAALRCAAVATVAAGPTLGVHSGDIGPASADAAIT